MSAKRIDEPLDLFEMSDRRDSRLGAHILEMRQVQPSLEEAYFMIVERGHGESVAT